MRNGTVLYSIYDLLPVPTCGFFPTAGNSLCLQFNIILTVSGDSITRADQFSSVIQSCPTLWDPMGCSIPGLPVLHYLPEFAQTHVGWVSDAIQPSHPLLPLSPPAFNLSQHQGLLQGVGSSHQGPKYWSFSFSISPSNSELISFRIDWFDLLAIQGTVKSLLQHQSSKASILWSSAFFIGPSLKSFDYMDLCQQSDVCFLNRLSRFVTFMHWRRRWQPTPVFLPGESQGRGSLVGCRLWGHTESDTTEAT